MSPADRITWSRIVLIVPTGILIGLDLVEAALVLHLFAIVTDFFDGVVARHTATVSERGADLDGAADMALAFSSVVWSFLLVRDWRFLLMTYSVLGIALMALYFAVCRRKTGRFIVLHLWSGRIAAGLAYALFPLVVLLHPGRWYVHLVGFAVAAFYVEALIYVFQGKTDPNGRSALF